MKKNGMIYLLAMIFILCAGCSRDMRSADVNEESVSCTYTYQEGAHYRLVTERRLQFVFSDGTTLFMRAGDANADRVICTFEQTDSTGDRRNNIYLGEKTEICAIYVCCEEEDFVLAVVRKMFLKEEAAAIYTSFTSLSTGEQLDVAGSFMYEREGLYTFMEGTLGVNVITHISCKPKLSAEETAGVSEERRYMTPKPMTLLLNEADSVQAEDFLDTDEYLLIPAGTVFTVVGQQVISHDLDMPIYGYCVRAELSDKAVTGWFLLDKYDNLLLQNASLTTVISTIEKEPSDQICSADSGSSARCYNVMSAGFASDEQYELLLINFAYSLDGISTSELMLQSSDAAEKGFSEILSAYKAVDTHADLMVASGLGAGSVYTDYQILSLPEGANGVCVDNLMGLGMRNILAVTCTYEDGSTSTRFFVDFLGKIVELHTAEQSADGTLVRTNEEIGLPVAWTEKWGMNTVSSLMGDDADYIYTEQYVTKNSTQLRQGRLVIAQDEYTAEYVLMGADLLVRVK